METERPRPRLIVVPLVVAICLVAWILPEFVSGLGRWLYRHFALWPQGVQEVRWVPTWGGPVRESTPYFRIWQVITYGFLHGPWWHLLVNLAGFIPVGRILERHWGASRFLFYFLYCTFGAGLVQSMIGYFAAKQGALYPTIGASGGVFGMLLAFAIMYPHDRLEVRFGKRRLGVPVLRTVICYGLAELLMGFFNPFGGVAHFAHVAGMLFGLPLVLAWRRHGELYGRDVD